MMIAATITSANSSICVMVMRDIFHRFMYLADDDGIHEQSEVNRLKATQHGCGFFGVPLFYKFNIGHYLRTTPELCKQEKKP